MCIMLHHTKLMSASFLRGGDHQNHPINLEHLHSHLFSILINYIKLLSPVSSGPPIHPSLHSRVFNVSYTSLPHQTPSAIQPLPSNPYPTSLHSHYIPINYCWLHPMIFLRNSLFSKNMVFPLDSHEIFRNIPMSLFLCGIIFLREFPYIPIIMSIIFPLYVQYIFIILPYISIIYPLYSHDFIYSHEFIYSHDIPTRFSLFSHCISIIKWLIHPSQALFQDGELTFTAAKRRKQRDRILQALVLLGSLVLGGSFENIHGLVDFVRGISAIYFQILH